MTDEAKLPSPAAPSTARLERLDDLAAGQYWRALKDLPAVKWTYRRYEEGRAVTDGRAALAGGSVLLVKSLRHVDGVLHTVILAPHPLEAGAEDRRFLAEEFFAAFERATDAAAVRRAEIGAVEAEIATLQTELVDGPRDLPQIAPPPANPSLGQLIAAAPRVEALKENANALVEVSQKRARWVEEKVRSLSAHTATLARFHQEQATAAMAAVEDVMRYADHLASGVKTLGLYTGDGVEVVELASGAEAPASEPLTLYQRKLFMDEEWLVHLKSGGADFSDLPAFGAALARDRSLLTRILPDQRSIVLMQYRREAKSYFAGEAANAHDAIARALAEAERNKANFTTFLLIRNGERVYQVYSELSTQDAERLFPTKQEAEKLFRRGGAFRGIDATRIGIDDLDYTDALAAHQKSALFYKRLLVLIWGLNDRLGLFGSFYDRARYGSWLAPDFQAEHFRFVQDDENALVDMRPPFFQWAREMNAHLQAGSRVVARWDVAMDPDTAPGATRWIEGGTHGRNVAFRYRPVTPEGFAVVRARGKDLVAEVRCRYDGWRDVRRAEIDAQVVLNRYVGKPGYHGTLEVLCLDAVKAADLDYYLNSRAERRSYLDYVDLFVAARDRLKAEEEEARPFVTSLREAALAAGLVESDADGEARLDHAIEEAVRLWRANRFGRAVPRPGDADYTEALEAIGAFVHRMLTGGMIDPAAVAALAASGGRKPLRLVATGKGGLVLYATPTDAEHLDFDGAFPWVARLPLKASRKGLAIAGTSRLVSLEVRSAAEKTLHEWPEADAHVSRATPEARLEHRDVARLLSQARVSDEVLALMTARALDEARFAHWLDVLADRLRRFSRTSVVEPMVTAPLAMMAIREDGDRKESRIELVMATGYLADLLYTLADEDGRAEVQRVMAEIYANPGRRLERLAARAHSRDWLRLSAMALDVALTAVPEIAAHGFVPPTRVGAREKAGRLDPTITLEEAVAAGLKHKTVLAFSLETRTRSYVVRDLGWFPWTAEVTEALARAWPATHVED